LLHAPKRPFAGLWDAGVAYWARLKRGRSERELLTIVLAVMTLSVTIVSTLAAGFWTMINESHNNSATPTPPTVAGTTLGPPAAANLATPVPARPEHLVSIDGVTLRNSSLYYTGPEYDEVPALLDRLVHPPVPPGEALHEVLRDKHGGLLPIEKYCFQPTKLAREQSEHLAVDGSPSASGALLEKASPTFDVTLRNDSATLSEVLHGVRLQRGSTVYESISGGGETITGTVLPVKDTVYLRVAGDRPTAVILKNPIMISPNGVTRLVVKILLADEHPMATDTETNIPASYTARLEFDFGGGVKAMSKNLCIMHLW
jgi:hypothetical protein